jgi:hypothetical protein
MRDRLAAACSAAVPGHSTCPTVDSPGQRRDALPDDAAKEQRAGMSATDTSQPDLRGIVAGAVNQLHGDNAPVELRLSQPVTPDRIAIRCQRTWFDIRTWNPLLNGAAFAACIAQFRDGGRMQSYFVEAARPAGAADWRCAGLSGGPVPDDRAEQAGGLMIASGSHVCAGGIGRLTDGGVVRVERADGSVYEDHVVDGCAIVFAPVTARPGPGDSATVRYIRADGSELGADTVQVGDGGPPSNARPRA